jgi:hypothetical protein
MQPWPHLDESRYFVSGSNHAGEIRGLAASGSNVGVAAPEVNAEAFAALCALKGQVGIDRELHGFKRRVFVDSGAFSEVGFGPQGPFIAEPITHAEWLERLTLYARLAYHLGKQLYVVAPDCVAHQAETLVRLETYDRWITGVRRLGANVIVPIQKGPRYTMGEFFRIACDILNVQPHEVIAGIPMKKDATTLEELAEFCDTLPLLAPPAIHFLGLGLHSKRYPEALAVVRRHVEIGTEVFCDSVRITALVGRTNGPGGGPRPLTAARDAMLKEGVTGTAEIKARSIVKVWGDAYEGQLDDAVRAGWYDDELLDGPAPDLVTYRQRVELASGDVAEVA